MLHTLGLRGNRLTKESLTIILANVPNRSLRHLDLSQNDLRGSSVTQLCQVLAHLNSKISSLELSNVHLGTADVKAICDAAVSHETSWLLDLSLSHNSLESAAMGHIASLLSYKGCSLNWLDISWNSFDVFAGGQLATALAVNKSLSTLNIAANSLRDEGGQHIAACLLSNHTLREIFMSLNNIGGKTCFIFSKVLFSKLPLINYILSFF
jgi:Ran GTPase-activating protein (RanGAP) involved in mRNA processing and transport